MTNRTRDEEVKKLYLDGKSRQEAMVACGITNTNSMSSLSSRLGLRWNWPLSSRKSGVRPALGSGSGSSRTTPFRGATAPVRVFKNEVLPDVVVPETIPNAPPHRFFGPYTQLSSREKRIRGYQDNSDVALGGRLSPFPTPSEVSGNPDDLSRAEIHALATLYRG